MYSAGDSSGDGFSGLNQFAGMSGSIDWAAMAQQWIQMHDTGSFSSMPDAPPPPSISNIFNDPNAGNNSSVTANITPAIKKLNDEKGEADMDMDEDEDNNARGDASTPPGLSMQLEKNRDQTIMQSHAPWYMQQQSQMLGPALNENLVGIGSASAQITPGAVPWSSTIWPPRINLPPPVTPPMLGVSLNGPIQNSTAHIPSLLKMNVPNPNTLRMMAPNIDEQNSAAVVDAKKRKMLPAWIREGLEKMEREKQKQLEREQNKKREESESSGESIKYSSVGTTDDMHTVNMKYKHPAELERSGIDEVEEAEDLDGVAINEDTLVISKTTSTNEDDGSATSGNDYETDHENNSDQHNYKGNRSYEDRLSELMIVVRTTLTELLLEVTNQEIANLAHEAVNAHKAKASSAQVIRKSALSSITGKLGLAAYDDSTGDESSDSDDDVNADNDPNNDSEEEIKASIRMKRRAFAKITDEIEERIAASGAREEQKLKYYTSLEKQKQDDELYKKTAVGSESKQNDEDRGRMKPSTSAKANAVSKSYDGDFGETTETKLQHSNGKRQKDRHTRKERTTRFSDNKDSKSAASVAATYISKIQSVNVNPNGNAVFPISTPNTSSVAKTTVTASASPSSSINTLLFESSHLAYNIAGSKLVDDSSGVSTLNKNLLNAAEAAYEKVTKRHRSSSNRSSVSRSEKRERDHCSSRYDHRDYKSGHHRERESERERYRDRKRKSGRESERNKERDLEQRLEKHQHKHKDEHSSDDGEEADDKSESKTSSSDTDSTSSSSTSSTSTSQHSSHYSRTSTSSKRRREHDYDRRDRRDDRSSQRSRRSGRSRSRSRRRSNYHQRSSSHRHSSAEDDNDSRNRYSSSRHDSSSKRSRSRSRSTYSSSSHWRRR